MKWKNLSPIFTENIENIDFQFSSLLFWNIWAWKPVFFLQTRKTDFSIAKIKHLWITFWSLVIRRCVGGVLPSCQFSHISAELGKQWNNQTKGAQPSLWPPPWSHLDTLGSPAWPPCSTPRSQPGARRSCHRRPQLGGQQGLDLSEGKVESYLPIFNHWNLSTL